MSKAFSASVEMQLSGFPDSSVGKESACGAGDPSLIPGLGRSAGVRDRLPTPVFLGFPGGSVVKYPPANAGEEMQVPPLGQEGPTPVFLPEKSADKGAWRATVHGVAGV